MASSRPVQTLVIDILDPASDAPDAIVAATSLLAPGDRIALFHSLFDERLEGSDRHSDNALVDEARERLLTARGERLDTLAAELADRTGAVVAGTSLSWTRARWQKLLSFAREQQATLVIAPSSRPRPWRPLAKALDDWQLIRHSDVPLLLTRPGTRHDYRSILAAVDPLHVDDKPAELDGRILRHAGALARRHNASLCVLNVVPPVTTAAPAAGAPTVPVHCLASEQVAAHRERLDHLVEETACAANEICVVSGTPAQEIVDHAAEHDVDLVVMGAVSRSMLRNALIGNTAEKVLDQLKADTLIIKPAAAAPRLQ